MGPAPRIPSSREISAGDSDRVRIYLTVVLAGQCGKDEAHPGPPTGGWLRPDPSALGLDETPGDRQPEASAPAGRGACAVGPPERLENPLGHLRGDTDPRVLDRNEDGSGPAGDRNGDLPPAGCSARSW